jgi:hypothetical protein
MESGPGLKPVDNETFATAIRTTQSGQKYTYKLNVLQQPQRARACGAGAKCESAMPHLLPLLKSNEYM